MSIKNVIKSAVLSTGILAGASSCRGPIHRVSQDFAHPIVHRVDSFASSIFNKAETEGLELFMVDTIRIKDKMLNKPKQLMYDLQDKAASSIKKVTVDVQTNVTPVLTTSSTGSGEMGVGLATTTTYIKAPIYLPSTVKAVMQKKVFANKDETKFFVPVEYYAARNPMIEPKHFR